MPVRRRALALLLVLGCCLALCACESANPTGRVYNPPSQSSGYNWLR